jgi:hypothetical protein
VIQRYNLKTFEKEATVQSPVDSMTALCMGSASKGPLLICPQGNQWGAKPVLVDPIKLKVIPGGDQLPAAAAPFIRASADGRMFGWRNSTGSEGHEMSIVELTDDKPKPRSFWAGTSLLLPGPDGRYIYCGEGVFTTQFKKLHPTDGNKFDQPYLPAASGSLFMQLETKLGGRFPGDPQAAAPGPGKVNFFLPGQYKPFASIDKVEGLYGESYGYGAVREPLMHDRRVHLCPDAGKLVVIPSTNDKLILYPFKLDDLLAKSEVDYLIVTTEPPTDAARGTTLSYAPVVRARKGGVKVKLESGPDGMKMVDGKLTWAVPADLADKEVDVILSISDSTGQELFQTFKLAVRDRRGDEKVAPPDPAPAVPPPKGGDPVPPKGGDPVPPKDAKPMDLVLRPAALEKDEQTVNLPSAAGEVVAAAGGRLLVIHLPKERKFALFDTAAVKIVKYLPVAEDEIKFAAGQDKLIVLLPAANLIQRWNLATFERELSVANPIGSPVKALAMGSGSNGPLVVTTKSPPNGFGMPTILLYDPKTFKKSDVEFNGGHFHPQYPPEVRVSANGDLLTAWVPGLSPQGVYIWAREGKAYKGGSYYHETWGSLLPDPEGRTVYANRGKAASSDGKQLKESPKGVVVPAVQGPMVLALDSGPGAQKQPRATIHLDRSATALVTVPSLNGLAATGRWPEHSIFLIPDAKLLVLLSDSGDKLILHRFDLDALLAKSDADFLFVTGRPPGAVCGAEFSYKPNVRSKKGGVKVKLDASPDGMTVAADGTVTWKVPDNFADSSVAVILTISDSSGQEIFHTFELPVRARP